MIDNVRSSHESEFWKAVEKQKFCDLDLDLFQRIIPQIERIINGFIPDARMEMQRCPPSIKGICMRDRNLCTERVDLVAVKCVTGIKKGSILDPILT